MFGLEVFDPSGAGRVASYDTLYRLHSTHIVEFATSDTYQEKTVSISGFNPGSGEWNVYYVAGRTIRLEEYVGYLKVIFDTQGSLTFGGSMYIQVFKK